MGYVSSNLMPGEEIVYQAKIHWIVFVPGALLFVIGVALAGLKIQHGVGIIAGGIVLLASLYLLLKALVHKLSTELAVTSRRVIAKSGLVMRHTVELNHSKVESFTVDQGILGRIFDFGTLVVNGTGGGKTPIPNIDAPLEFRRRAMQTIDSSQGGRG
jgi:uncharacterized membrane protein YdbT with pleckstrin-like domain